MKNYIVWATPVLVLGVVITVALTSITEELPEEFKGHLSVIGDISSCEIEILQSNTSKVFVGVQLADSEIPLLRISTSRNNRSYYKNLCDNNEKVRVNYHASKKFLLPLYFWIDSIEKV
jgi:hypothetical protein